MRANPVVLRDALSVAAPSEPHPTPLSPILLVRAGSRTTSGADPGRPAAPRRPVGQPQRLGDVEGRQRLACSGRPRPPRRTAAARRHTGDGDHSLPGCQSRSHPCWGAGIRPERDSTASKGCDRGPPSLALGDARSSMPGSIYAAGPAGAAGQLADGSDAVELCRLRPESPSNSQASPGAEIGGEQDGRPGTGEKRGARRTDGARAPSPRDR